MLSSRRGTREMSISRPVLALGQVDAGLHEELLHEGVAHLHRGAQLSAVLVEDAGGEDVGAADAVAAGVGPHQQEGVAGAGGKGPHQAVDAGVADAHGVHQRVAGVGPGEAHLAGHGGDAQAVAVASDAADDTGEEVAVVPLTEGAEAQGVQDRDGPRPHGEDVAHDAAHPGRRSLVGLHEGRVVVRLDLHHYAEPVADVDGAGVLAPHAGQDSRARIGEHA
jgi:hypothetical protein